MHKTQEQFLTRLQDLIPEHISISNNTKKLEFEREAIHYSVTFINEIAIEAFARCEKLPEIDLVVELKDALCDIEVLTSFLRFACHAILDD